MLGGVVAEMLALCTGQVRTSSASTEETMKNMVIKTLDFLSGLLVVLSLIGGVLWTFFGPGYYGVLVGAGVFVGACFTCGFWMALSKIIENQERMLALNQRLLQSMGNLDDNLSASMIKALASQARNEPVKTVAAEA